MTVWVRVRDGWRVCGFGPGAEFKMAEKRARHHAEANHVSLITDPTPPAPVEDRTGWQRVRVLREIHEGGTNPQPGDVCLMPPDRAEWLAEIGSVEVVA
jgi:hypothetical protein